MSALVLALALLPAACYVPPVDAPIVDPFREPACAQCAGNRGLEYATAPGTPVRAVAGGIVSFSGVVAGTRYVVVDQPDGYRTTYGRLAAATARTGAPGAVAYSNPRLPAHCAQAGSRNGSTIGASTGGA